MVVAGVSRGGAVGDIRLRQAVCGLWAVVVGAVRALVMVVKGARVCARGVRVQQRTADLIVVGAVMARGLVVRMLLRVSGSSGRAERRAGILLREGLRSLQVLGTP
jgi:hypothetical protein